jgi:alkylated DNA repair dioxygenase AlkB
MTLFNTHNEIPLPFTLPAEEGYRAVWDNGLNGFRITIPDGELLYAEHFFDRKNSDDFLAYLLANDTIDWQTADWLQYAGAQLEAVRFRNMQWRHDQIRLFGKAVFQPRYSAWYGDPGAAYTYSGLTLQPQPWNEGLLAIKNRIEPLAGVQFNSVLLNWYRTGNDHMGWHSDDEKELGRNPVIGSVNFGATRRFLFRRIDNRNKKFELPLKHGTFLLMSGAIQHHWQHRIPKEKKINGVRINLTFRVVNPS